MSAKLTQNLREEFSFTSLTTVDVRKNRELTETEKDRELTMVLSLEAGPEQTKPV